MKSNKWFKLGLLTLSVLMVGAMAFTSIDGTVFADDSDPDDPEETLPFGGFGPGQDHPMRGRTAQFMRYGHEAYLQSIADQSGLTLEDLQTAQDNRVWLNDVLSEAGFSEAEVDEILLNAQYAVVDQGVADGHLTEEEAITRKAQLAELAAARVEWQANRAAYQTQWIEQIAEKTGLSVEELQAAHDAGTPIHQLLEETMSVDEAQAVLDETRQELLDQAVADGLITAEQAELWQNRADRPNMRSRFNEGMNETFGDDWQDKLHEHFQENNTGRPDRNSDSSFGRGGRGFEMNSSDS